MWATIRSKHFSYPPSPGETHPLKQRAFIQRSHAYLLHSESQVHCCAFPRTGGGRRWPRGWLVDRCPQRVLWRFFMNKSWNGRNANGRNVRHGSSDVSPPRVPRVVNKTANIGENTKPIPNGRPSFHAHSPAPPSSSPLFCLLPVNGL